MNKTKIHCYFKTNSSFFQPFRLPGLPVRRRQSGRLAGPRPRPPPDRQSLVEDVQLMSLLLKTFQVVRRMAKPHGEDPPEDPEVRMLVSGLRQNVQQQGRLNQTRHNSRGRLKQMVSISFCVDKTD